MAETPSLRGMTPYQAIQAFQRAGYAVERVGGGHFVLEHPTRPPLELPYRAIEMMAEGLLLTQIRTAGFTGDEFARLQENS
jgi:predicted RNA binding protein YcfA (HicA-like mRNA interferase family)